MNIDILALTDIGPVNSRHVMLPQDAQVAVLATRTPLLEPNSPSEDIWWRLPSEARHALRVVYFTNDNTHAVIAAAVRGDPKDATQAVVNWLRWLAVRQAKSEGKTSWPDAYDEASKRLHGTVARGKARTMKAAYLEVQYLLKESRDTAKAPQPAAPA